MRVYTTWALCSLTVLAATIPQSNEKKAFSLGLKENADYQGVDAPAQLYRALAKYGGYLSPALSRAIGLDSDTRSKFHNYMAQAGDMTGTVANYPPPFFDIQYVATVEIGTPPQEMNLNLDTGSADFWTFSTSTYRSQVREQTLYAPKDSNTSKFLEGEAWSIKYGDGASASGIVYEDRVQIGDTSFDKQAVQAAVQVSREITTDPFSSGIVGLGFSDGNTVRPTKQKTYLENIKDDLKEPVFTANLQKGVPGNYNFGYLNKSEYTGEIGYAPVERGAAYWKITVSGYQVGADGEFGDYDWKAIVDTGTSLLLLPKSMVDFYYSKVEGAFYDGSADMMLVPCNATLPDFIFQVGDYNGTVPGHYINYGKRTGGRDCYGGIQIADGISFAVLGDILLKSQFVVFDIGKERVGFAAKDILPPKNK